MSLLQVNTIRNKSGGGAPTFDRGINVVGVSSFGTVRISSGIVTATSGIITYYGDGRYLTNVGLALTYVDTLEVNDFVADNISVANTITTGDLYASGNISAGGSITASDFYGNGSNLTGIVTSLVAGNNIELSGSTGRITISATASATGIASISDDTNPKLGGNLDLNTYSVVGTGNVNISGIITATRFYGSFYGDGSSLENVSGIGTLTEITLDTSSSTTHYVTFVSDTSGNLSQKVSSSGLTFVPSTGTLGVSSLTCSGIIEAATVIASEVNFNGNATITGDLDVLGDISSSSDIRLKKNIKPIENSLEKIEYLNGVHFDWIKTDASSIGLIAQDVEKVFPEIVKESDDNTKTINYNSIIAVLVESIKELKKEIEELKSNK